MRGAEREEQRDKFAASRVSDGSARHRPDRRPAEAQSLLCCQRSAFLSPDRSFIFPSPCLLSS